MKTISIDTTISIYNSTTELNQTEQQLISAAQDASKTAYSPYSNFNVGAAVLLENGTIVTGSNQENAAYPSGLCAERVALFYANAQFPNEAVIGIAIAASNANGWVKTPISPCGACRQVLLETEHRYQQEFYTLLSGESYIYKINAAKDLLPLCFSDENLL